MCSYTSLNPHPRACPNPRPKPVRLAQVAAERERGGLAHEKQAAEAATAEAAQRGEIAASEAVAAERRHGEAQSRELAISRAELHAQQEHIQAELLELLASREAQLEAAEARTHSP